MNRRKRILITGGAGYIGSHTNKLLANSGYETVVYDNLVYGHLEFVKWGDFVHGDLLDLDRLRTAFAEHAISGVIHFAAFAYVGESVRDPEKYYRNNVAGTLNLLSAMREFGVRDIIFSSTCATYGVPREIPIPETHAQAPINPYGWSKLMIERVIEDYARAYGTRYVLLRYFNAAGADPDGELGELHDPETHLIPLVIRAALGQGSHVEVYGTDYPTPDGTCIRDYIHVHDLASAHLQALRALEAGRGNKAFNLGNGSGHSVSEVLEKARRIVGRDFPVVFGSRRPGDPPRLVGSSALAGRELGWTPIYPGLQAIMEHAFDWHSAVDERVEREAQAPAEA
jgi:UDP-glucose 4-epimerase